MLSDDPNPDGSCPRRPLKTPGLAVAILGHWAQEEEILHPVVRDERVAETWRSTLEQSPELSSDTDFAALNKTILVDRNYRLALRMTRRGPWQRTCALLRMMLAAAIGEHEQVVRGATADLERLSLEMDEWAIYCIARSALIVGECEEGAVWAGRLRTSPEWRDAARAIEALCTLDAFGAEQALELFHSTLSEPSPGCPRPWFTMLLGALENTARDMALSSIERAWLGLLLDKDDLGGGVEQVVLESSLAFGALLRKEFDLAERIVAHVRDLEDTQFLSGRVALFVKSLDEGNWSPLSREEKQYLAVARRRVEHWLETPEGGN